MISTRIKECKISFLLFSMVTFFNTAFSQQLVTGTIKDADTKAVLPFVNIGIKGKDIGTNALSDGTFSILIPVPNEKDILTFSMAGYSEMNLPAGKIKENNQKEFFLKVKATELDNIIVSASRQKLIEKKFGITAKPLVSLGDGSTNQNDIFEIAQLIRRGKEASKITFVNLYINDSERDSGTFRINFYSFDGNRPAERISEKSIVETKAIQPGWLKFDVRKYKIHVKGDFVVAFEFIPSVKTHQPIYYGIKLGGTSKSFVRTHSHGDWGVPPHHYRIFITALVEDKKNKNTYGISENKESAPTVTLYSASVRDSFSLFISLPADYNKNKHNFPVIFLLDANVFFDAVANEMREEKVNAILVGIGYKDFILMDSLRNRDYTYPVADAKFGFEISGGADKFLSFLKTELLPYIERNYRADPARFTLEGHSLGGYFTLYALARALETNQSTFSNYVAASPSLHYSNFILKLLQDLPEKPGNKQALFITYGAMEDSEDGEITTEGIDNFNAFTAVLSGKKFSNIKLKQKVYPAFGHMETAVPTFSESLRLLNDNKKQ